ncbi:peptidase domain-containing ABC transporter [Dyadobacter sp. 3J3]|uniref:peptidase domain-containing ABC transporter n=1 Tax=Dyadobacter sp. 3J3 TaxID=2606600 RepID=UPI00135BCF16|nr:peptidase domain-containing ABC transporter [Dyadobacter sp. 3J3]
MLNQQAVRKTCVRQQDSSDCGVACLRSVLHYYGGDISLERLREISGTSIQGTTLLGLYEAANQVGFDAEGCEADLPALVEHGEPTILHVIMEGDLEHYVLWYGVMNAGSKSEHPVNQDGFRKHIIGDPARGIVELTDQELLGIWQSGKCLTLKPNNQFIKSNDQSGKKRAWFINLIREDISLLMTASGLGLLMAILGMVMAVFSQKLIDDILPSKNMTKLITGISLVAFLLFVRIGLEMLRTYILLRQSKDFSNRIISKFYENLLNLPKAFFDKRKTGDIVARMNDTSRIQRVVSELAGQVLIDILVVTVSIGFLFFYSWQISLALIVCLPAYFLLIFRFHKPISANQRQVMQRYALSESNFISSISGIRPIKAFNRQTVFGELNRSIYGTYQDGIWGLGIIQLRLNLYASISGVIILMGILAASCYMVLHGQLKTGELMAIIGMSSSLLPSVAGLALLAIPLNEAKIAFERMYEFAGLPSENSSNGEKTDSFSFQNLQLKNITFRFPGRRAILNEFSLELKKGEILGLIGESGCGKSTLLQLIERFYKPESGQILINDDTNLESISLEGWRKNVACVPQDVHIFNGTVLDNVILGLKPDRENLETFFSHEPYLTFLNTLPQGLMTLVGEEGLNLSGGQKQWIGIMRALFQKPGLLLLDEATSAMDAQSEQKVLNLLSCLNTNMAILHVSHRLHTLANFCDRIYILDEGKLVNSGSHEILLETDNMYSRFWKHLEPEFLVK